MNKNNAVKLEDRADETIELSRDGVAEIASELRELLADVFALYVKTKNFHWHMSGRHFRDYHLLLDEQADQLFAMTDEIAERARKIGGTTLHSISDISAHQRLTDNNREVVSPDDMLGELLADSRRLIGFLRVTHETCGRYKDVATTSLIEVWIDQAERRTWFLAEIVGGV
jgi:starvation-inducible DNA-binding protein